MAEIDADKISFISPPSGGRDKVLGSEAFGNISHVTPQHLSVGSQRIEILQKSLGRIIAVAALLFLCQIQYHLSQPQELIYIVFIALTVATCVSGPLFFLFNGGLTIKDDVDRFYFTLLKQGKPFYIEIEPAHESEIHQALLSAGLGFERIEEDEEVWECDECGSIVDALAAKCPHCGADFEN